MGGGVAQAYSTMGFCTFMKTVEVTRHRAVGVQQSSLQIAADIFKREGIMGINKGVNAVGRNRSLFRNREIHFSHSTLFQQLFVK